MDSQLWIFLLSHMLNPTGSDDAAVRFVLKRVWELHCELTGEECWVRDL